VIFPAVLGLALSLVTTPGELAARAAGSVTILDARPASDYRRGHVPGARQSIGSRDEGSRRSEPRKGS
jgi:rhodanese-related sulfurtransferase